MRCTRARLGMAAAAAAAAVVQGVKDSTCILSSRGECRRWRQQREAEAAAVGVEVGMAPAVAAAIRAEAKEAESRSRSSSSSRRLLPPVAALPQAPAASPRSCSAACSPPAGRRMRGALRCRTGRSSTCAPPRDSRLTSRRASLTHRHKCASGCPLGVRRRGRFSPLRPPLARCGANEK